MTFEYSANFELKFIYTIKSMKFDYCINFVILKKKISIMGEKSYLILFKLLQTRLTNMYTT